MEGGIASGQRQLKIRRIQHHLLALLRQLTANTIKQKLEGGMKSVLHKNMKLHGITLIRIFVGQRVQRILKRRLLNVLPTTKKR